MQLKVTKAELQRQLWLVPSVKSAVLDVLGLAEQSRCFLCCFKGFSSVLPWLQHALCWVILGV